MLDYTSLSCRFDIISMRLKPYVNVGLYLPFNQNRKNGVNLLPVDWSVPSSPINFQKCFEGMEFCRTFASSIRNKTDDKDNI